MDVETSASIMDFLSIDRVSTTGLLLFLVWYFMNELKKEKKRFLDVLKEKERKIEELQDEKEELLKK